jgi:hypothetical protein
MGRDRMRKPRNSPIAGFHPNIQILSMCTVLDNADYQNMTQRSEFIKEVGKLHEKYQIKVTLCKTCRHFKMLYIALKRFFQIHWFAKLHSAHFNRFLHVRCGNELGLQKCQRSLRADVTTKGLI